MTVSFLERKRLELARRRERHATYGHFLDGVRRDEAEDRRHFYAQLVSGASRADQEYLCDLILLALDEETTGTGEAPIAPPVAAETVPSPATARSGESVAPTTPSRSPSVIQDVEGAPEGLEAVPSPPRPTSVLDVIEGAPEGLAAVEIVARLCPHGHALEEIARGACDTRPLVERALREAETRRTIRYDGRRWLSVPRDVSPGHQDRQERESIGESGSQPNDMASYIRHAVAGRPPTIAALIKEVVASQPLEASAIAAAVGQRNANVKKRSIIGELHLLHSRGEVVRVRWGQRGPEYGLPPDGVVVPPREPQTKKSPPRRAAEATTSLNGPMRPGVPAPRWRTMRSLIVEVMESSGQPMTTAEVVAGVLALDPARRREGIKSEMGRMREDKLFDIVGKDAGGVYVHALKAGVKTGT
jgi:hypothetical protein